MVATSDTFPKPLPCGDEVWEGSADEVVVGRGGTGADVFNVVLDAEAANEMAVV